ncbi:uncharacterized protein LOC141637917 isoform X1 [Silene latifolia]|uniref:uncharacterized protein LOC141637917 isoform X1 n=2 Tax=Silene latifolia TaxID=37657 RepID=UPI003D780C77
MCSCLIPSTIKKISLIPRKFSNFQAFSHFNSSLFSRYGNSNSYSSISSNNAHFPGDMEDSIYAILTIGRWESLNHMGYKLPSLRPVHGRLALKFLKWVIKQPGLEVDHITHTYCITIHILVRARMYDHARSLFHHLAGMSDDPSSLFGALMGTYRLCRSNPSVFDLLIRVYLKLGCVDNSIEIFRLMDSRGFKPSVHTCNMILSATMQHNVAWSFFKEMLAMRICPDVSTFNVLLNLLCSEGNLKKAGYLLEKMEQAGYAPNAVTYNTMLSSYCKKRQYKSACFIMDQMNNKGVQADVCTYNVLIGKLCKSRRSAKGYLMLRRMRNQKVLPNAVTYNTLINGFVKEEKLGIATKVFEEMVKLKLYPNHITYNTLLDGHCHQGNFQEAFSIMRKMEAAGVSPNEVTYGTLLNGLCKHSKFEQARSVMESMRINGFEVSCIIYTMMMDGFCKKGMLNEAVELFLAMMEERVYPDVITYSVLINGFCTMGKLGTAKEILCNMYRVGVLPNHVMYATMIYSLCKQGRVMEALKNYAAMNFDGYKADIQTCNLLVSTMSGQKMFLKAENFMQHMSRMGTIPNSVTYDCMIDGYSNIGDESKAFSLFDEMIEQGHCPSRFTYGSLLKGLCRGGNLWAAKKFFKLVHCIPGVADIVSYNTLLGEMCKLGKLTDAMDLCHKMIRNGILPDEHTYASLLSGLCKKGKIVIAILLFEDSVQKGILSSSSLVVQTILVDALFKTGHPNVASYFYEDMVRSGVYLDVIAANTISHGYSRNGMMVKAEEVFELLKERSSPNLVSYNILLHGHAKQGNLSNCLGLYNSLKKKGFLPDSLTCYSLILGLCESRSMELALKSLRKMILEGIIPNQPTFNLLVRKYSERGFMDIVFDLTDVMMALGLHLDRAIYDSIITGLTKKSAFRESHLVFHEMLKNGYVPSYRQYVTLLKGMFRTRDVAGAFKVKDEMVNLGVSSPDVADSAMVRALVKCGRIDDAKMVFDLSLKKHQVPSVVTFTTIMHGLCKSGRVTEALELRETMDRFKMKPDIILYNVLILGLCGKGDTDVAFELYTEMKQIGLWANITTFEALINGILGKNDLPKGEMILMDMLERGFLSHVGSSDDPKQLLLSALTTLNFLRQKKNMKSHD